MSDTQQPADPSMSASPPSLDVDAIAASADMDLETDIRDPDPPDLPSEEEIRTLIRESEVTLSVTPNTDEGFIQYLRELQRYPVLTSEQEQKLGQASQAGNGEARRALIRHNLRFVVTVARKHQPRGLEVADLVQDGNMGLIRAAQRFDPSRGVKFISYAIYWIQQAIRAGLARQQRIMRLPVNRASQMTHLMKAQGEYAREHGQPPGARELAEMTGIPLSTTRDLLKVIRPAVSLEATHPYEDEDSASLSERLADHTDVEAELEGRDREAKVLEILDKLTNRRDAEVLERFYGIGNKREHTLEEIGQLMGVTRERVRQIRDRAIRELRRRGLADELREYAGISFESPASGSAPRKGEVES